MKILRRQIGMPLFQFAVVAAPQPCIQPAPASPKYANNVEIIPKPFDPNLEIRYAVNVVRHRYVKSVVGGTDTDDQSPAKKNPSGEIPIPSKSKPTRPDWTNSSPKHHANSAKLKISTDPNSAKRTDGNSARHMYGS